MYLTKLKLSAGDHVRFRLRDAYAIHKLVYSLFPLDSNGDAKKQRILYADKQGAEGDRVLLIQSSVLPQGPDTLSMTSLQIDDAFYGAEHYHFEVTLNPVKKDPVSGKRQAIKGLLPVMKWLVERSPQWGFAVDEQTLQAFIQNTVTFQKDERQYCLHRVLFRGALSVTDQTLFRAAAENGLGHGKAFGFGLLQLSPIR